MTTHRTSPKASMPEPAAGRLATAPGTLAAAGALVFALVVTLDRLLADRGLAAEWPPETSSLPYLLRSAGLALASGLVVVGGRRLVVARLDAIDPRRVDPAGIGLSTPTGERAVAAIGATIALGSAVLLVVDPATLSSLAREDALVEWVSALLAFAAAGALVVAAAHRLRSGGPGAPLATIALAVVAGGFLLLGLEEVSWFQRVLDIESPDAFLNRNAQGEINLHNFATVATGNAYYVGAFVFAVALPYLVADRSLGSRWAWLEAVLPPRAVLVASVTAAGIVYEMWNVVWIQATFWMSLAVLLSSPRAGGSARTDRVLAVVLVATAAIYLGVGDTMIRSWDDTEVRELVIPWGLLVYGWAMLQRASLDRSTTRRRVT